MIHFLNTKFYINTLLIVSAVVSLFHLLVLFQVIPYQVVWASRLTTLQEMFVFEGVSLAINALLAFVLLQRGGYMRQVLPLKVNKGILWLFVLVFVLNTLGNLTAKSKIELIGGTLITLLCAFLCWKIARGR